MEKVSKVKNVRSIVSHKENIENLFDYIREVEQGLNDDLHQTLIKSSSLVKVNRNLKEIKFLGQVLIESFKQKGSIDEKLRQSLYDKIYENQKLILKELQKSMLKAVEALTEVEGNLITLFNFDEIVKIFNNVEIGEDI